MNASAASPGLTTEARPSEAANEAWGIVSDLFLSNRPRMLEAFAQVGLAPMQAMALKHLEPGTPLPMRALADALHCDNSNVTGIVDRLEAAGLVERRPAPHDRRVRALVVTDRGAEVKARVAALMRVPPPAIARLSERDAETLRDVLRRALEGAGQRPPTAAPSRP